MIKKKPVGDGLFFYLCRPKQNPYGEEQNDVLLQELRGAVGEMAGPLPRVQRVEHLRGGGCPVGIRTRSEGPVFACPVAKRSQGH